MPRAVQGSQASWGQMGCRGRWARLGRQDPVAFQVSKGLLDLQEQKGHQATRVHKDHRDHLDLWEKLAIRDHLAQWDNLASQVNLA